MDDPLENKPVDLSDVGAINNLDTARMALRWALERIHSFEKTKAELTQRAEEAAKAFNKEKKDREILLQSIALRAEEANQRELYYAKMEELISLRLAGKLDIGALVKSQAETAQLQQFLIQKQNNLDRDYEAKVEALERESKRLISEKQKEVAEQAQRAEEAQRQLRLTLDKEYASKLVAIRESEIRLKNQERGLAERTAHFEEFYNSQRAQLDRDIKVFREEVEDQVKFRLHHAEKLLSEKHAAIESGWEHEKAILIKELGQWRLQAQEHLPRIVELEQRLDASAEALRLSQSEADRHAMRLAKREQAWQDQKEILLQEAADKHSALEKELRQREAALADTLAQLKAARDKFSESAVNAQAAEEALRTKLTAQFQETLKTHKLEEAARLKSLAESWQTEKQRLVGEMAHRTELFERAQREIQALKSDLELQRAAFNKELSDKHALLEAAFREQANGLAQKNQEEIQRLAAEVEQRKAAFDAQTAALKLSLEKENLDSLSVYQKEQEARVEALSQGWELERSRLAQEISKKENELRRLHEEAIEQRTLLSSKASQEQAALAAAHAEAISSLEKSYQDKLLTSHLEQKDRFKALEDAWAKERLAFVLESAQQEAYLREAQKELLAERNSQNAFAAKAKAELEAMRTKLTQDFQKALAAGKIQEAEHIKILEAGWQTRRAQFVQEIAALEKSHEDKISASRQEQETRLKMLKDAWSKERLAFTDESAQRDAEIRELREQLRASRDAQNAAQIRSQATAEAIRAKLTQESQAEQAALTATHAQSLALLEKSNQEKLAAYRQAQEVRLKALEDAWAKERAVLAEREENLKAHYRQLLADSEAKRKKTEQA